MRIRVKNRKLFSVILAAVLLLTPVSAFAAGGATVNVNGYEDEGMDKDAISVTNVTKQLDPKTIEDWMDAYFEVQSPAVITTLENTALFTVYEMESVGGDFISGDSLDVSGQAKILVEDSTNADGYVEKIVDVSMLSDYEVGIPTLLKGSSVTLTEPGYYYVNFAYEAIAGSTDVFIYVVGSNAPAPAQTPAAPAKAEAKPTASKVLVNGAITSFEAYNIGGNNYFKLRDLASVLNGTGKQFEVEYNAQVKAINLLSNKAYTAVGGELAKGDGKVKSATLNTSKIYKDGREVSLTAYNINGNNYFKLRDIAAAFSIGVTWDSATNTVGIDTTKDYVD